MVFHTHDNMNDIVICTYGRGFWVLDDMSPLREVAAKTQAIESASAYLFKPGDAIRARENGNFDQPMNPEMPHSENPPFGAIIYYHLSKKPSNIKMDIFDSAGAHVRTITSVVPPRFDRPPYPDYWLKDPQERALTTNIGTNRINWNLRYDDPLGLNPDINNQMNAAPNSVTPGPHGPLVVPGVYTIKLTVDGQTYTQTVTVHNDPRIGESPAMMNALRSQLRLALDAATGMTDSFMANDQVADLRAQLAKITAGSPPPDVAAAAKDLATKLAVFGGPTQGGRGFGGGGGFGAPARQPGSVLPFSGINNTFYTVLGPLSQNGIDMIPTPAEIHTWESGCKEFTATVAAWKNIQTGDVGAFNALLAKNNIPQLRLATTTYTVPASCAFGPTGKR